jgi:hypothetical protein
MWAHKTNRLFFRGPDSRIMVADYTVKDESFAPAKPKVWSERNLAFVSLRNPYDLAPDDKRFAVLLYPGGTSEPEQKSSYSITVLLNFFDELRRRMPAGGK